VTYTWQEIEHDWLGGSSGLAAPPGEVHSAFNEVASRFGREWVEATRTRNGVVSRGTSPTLYIVTLAQLLHKLDATPNSSALIEKIRQGNSDARAELIAIYLLRNGNPEVLIEVEPEIQVGGHNRKPDFRARIPAEPWTYVEVTNPRSSEDQTNVRRGLERLTGLITECSGSFALEVFLKCEPSAAKIDLIADEILQGHQTTQQTSVELRDGLGTLYWNQYSPGAVVLDDHGEPYTPRLSATSVIAGAGEHRHITVRWPFTDTRAETFIRHEARQLPTDAPGLIMIFTSGAVGSMKAWRALIERRLQPNLHTRVSAVCLFSSGHRVSEHDDDWSVECKLIPNLHARYPLPTWIVQQLQRFPSDEIDILRLIAKVRAEER
jgi:hypothetical protein